MEWANQTILVEFFLKGLSGYPRFELLFFVLILIMYVVILLGNGTLILISILDSHLHTPMYFFLGNLSFLDICYTSTSIPSTLVSFLSERKTISFGCTVQMFLGDNRVCASWYDGLWPVCGYLQPSEISSHHEQEFLCAYGSWVLDRRSCQLCNINHVCSIIAFL